MGEYLNFGLCFYSVSNGTKEELFSVSDISLNKECVEKLAADFNDLQLSPIHIYEAIENSFAFE